MQLDHSASHTESPWSICNRMIDFDSNYNRENKDSNLKHVVVATLNENRVKLIVEQNYKILVNSSLPLY